MTAPLAVGQPRDTSVPTGPPIGGVTTVAGRNAGMVKYDPATRAIRPMSPSELMSAPKSRAAAADQQQQALDAAAQTEDADPNSPANVAQQDLDIEHPSAFAALRGGNRRKLPRPRRPGPVRR